MKLIEIFPYPEINKNRFWTQISNGITFIIPTSIVH